MTLLPDHLYNVTPKWFTKPLLLRYVGIDAGKRLFREADERQRKWRFWLHEITYEEV